MTRSGVDVIIGGGWAYFVPSGVAGSRRSDDLDLMSELRERMPVARSVAEMNGLEGASSAAVFLAPRDCPPASEREWTLAQLTSKALEILSTREEGFILMVEGSQIDWSAHDRDSDGIYHEMVDFDGAVGAALDFAEREGGTLVIMTSDHETGGMSLNEPPLHSSMAVKPAFTSGDHTMEMVPIFAYGPGSGLFGGIHDNTFIGTTLISFVKDR
jgi:alkaline phosphatase